MTAVKTKGQAGAKAEPTPRIKKGDHVYLIDGSGYLFRAYHALPPLSRKSDGLPTGAVAGFCNMLWKLLEDTKQGDKPTHLAVIFDAGRKTFRNEIFPEYKSHRPEPPDDLIPQFPLTREAVRAFCVACVELANYEADDLIATYARQAREKGVRVTIVSSDKDLMQLVVDGQIEMLDTMKNRRIATAEVIEKFGVPPAKVIAVQALAGDSSDNVPGIRGISVDSAAPIYQEFELNSLDELLNVALSGKLESECRTRLEMLQRDLDKEAGQPVKINSGEQLGELLFGKWKLEGGKKNKNNKRVADTEVLYALQERGNKFAQNVLRARMLSRTASTYARLLKEGADQARLSEKLVTLSQHVPVAETLESFAVREPDPNQLLPFLKKMDFAMLTRRAAAALGVENPDAIAPAEVTPGEAKAVKPQVTETAPAKALHSKGCPGAVMDRALVLKPVDYDAYETVLDVIALERWIARALSEGAVSVDTETTSLDPLRAALCGISLAVAPNAACYIPVGHRRVSGLDLAGGEKLKQLQESEVLKRLKPLLEDDSILKIGQNIKFDYLVFLKRGIRVVPFDDTMLMSYVLHAGLHGHGMDELSEKYLNHKPIAFMDVCGKGKDKITFDLVELKEATRYSAEDADVTLRLHRLFGPRLAAGHLARVYETLERPLVSVLADMEHAGITISPAVLGKLSNDFAQKMSKLESEIGKLAGQDFNPGSPKQLGDILFGKLSLPGGRKTTTGAWSTDADVLEDLALQGHELPKLVLEWRQLQKLRSTYTDALPNFVNSETGRVHTSYAQTGASTGRLASNDPNLQNIPIRTEEGRRIRQAFVAAPGHRLISADYSQIELRLLAHMADIRELKKAFADGLDIHAMTASEMFGVPVKGMPAEVRRRAKAINFGIIYGISAFGLANQLGIARGEADAYIRKYFTRFPGIRAYMERTKEFAREHGFVETLFGRRVYIREINSKMPGLRGGAERAAINAPLQGTAADIIRRAMIRLPEALARKKLTARTLLQVHDELVLEAPEAEVDEASAIAKQVMEKATLPVVELSVPLTVEAHSGVNWDEAH